MSVKEAIGMINVSRLADEMKRQCGYMVMGGRGMGGVWVRGYMIIRQANRITMK